MKLNYVPDVLVANIYVHTYNERRRKEREKGKKYRIKKYIFFFLSISYYLKYIFYTSLNSL